ncbi:ImmA/IrrE family metallo-endopeptidase [Nocardia farcinica]
MSSFRRGFKADAVRLALSIRAELGLGEWDRLDPYALAELYGIEVLGLDDLDCSNEAIEHFHARRSDQLSGYLLRVGPGAVIVENRSHPVERRKSTVCHEMSHVVLEHSFTLLTTVDDTWTARDGSVESEANWMAGELLVPQAAARRAAMRGLSVQSVADRYGVSLEMANWRMKISGGSKIRHFVALRKNQPN